MSEAPIASHHKFGKESKPRHLARPDQGVGVFSLARSDPDFFGSPRPADWEKLRLRRSCKVVAHETCHLFGMAHCLDYNCLMNGVNHLDELDSRSFFLCPVCLRKLRSRLGFDVGKRFADRRKFCLAGRALPGL